MGFKGFLSLLRNEVRLLRSLVYYRLYSSPNSERETVDRFHNLFYASKLANKTWGNAFWLGTRAKKCPLDLWNYQEIIFEVRPDVIVECGTSHGGCTLFLASVCDLVNAGRVVSIDLVKKKERPKHKRVKYLVGSSTSGKVVEEVRSLIGKGDKVMVVLDSDHNKGHVLEELRAYSPLVSRGSFLVVEDTNLNGHPVEPFFGPGPMEAVEEFLGENKDFVVDESREKFFLTFNPKGYLRRVK